MKRLLTVFALTALAARAAAADKTETPDVFTKLQPKMGAWGEYGWDNKKGDKVVKKGVFHTAVVGKEGDDFWLEQRITMEIPKPKQDRGPILMKILVGDEGAKKVYMKMGSSVMDMSGVAGSGERKKHKFLSKTKITEAGEETITVVAGKFKTTHYTYVNEKNTGDFWIKKGVGPYGLIKQIGHNGDALSTLELRSTGSDAKSEVDEKTAQSMFGAMMGGGRPAAGGSSADAGAGASPDSGSGSSAFGSMLGGALKRKALGSH